MGSGGATGGGLRHHSGGILRTASRHPRRCARLQALSRSPPYSSEFAVLGLSPFASASDVKRAYKRLALKYHPDVIRGETGHEKEETFKEIKSAYESLMAKLEGESAQPSGGHGDHDEWDEWDEWMGFEGGTPIFFTPS
ncbi:unnamed protein product [Spirodela intermedia]|nr:unnamed protein product [Spirodela intermedia]CAA6660160.1 unnamed protein product [Spirodela intermedia]